MANSDEITLTRALYGLTKNTAKLAFIFLIISAILISITYNDADPSFSTHTLVNNEEKLLYSFHVSEGDSELHLGYFTADDLTAVDYIDFRIQMKVVGESQVIYEDIIFSQSTQYYQDLSLESGDYQVVATLHLKSTADPNTRIDIVSGYGNLNLVLAALSILALVIGSISLGLFFALLPFTIFVLILNGINKPKAKKQSYSETIEPRVSHSINQSQTKDIEPVTQQEFSRPYRFEPNSFASKLTAKDWTWLIIALLSFIGFIFSPDSPFLFFSIIITAVIIYSVSEREKTKYRILILLKTNKTTSVAFLSRQLGKKEKYVIKILQIMILDEGIPIVLNLSSNRVQAIGDLGPFIKDNQRVYHPVTAQTDESEIPPQISEILEPVEQIDPIEAQPQNSEITSHCTACGEPLIGDTKYCYICGQKTI
ncbi:MAG: hypothetical protein HeimC2_17450 [Candidatus Heimdallarchaeota archaeon LC_2]|nr:MAG: hypothetical protein HeimC2_17450 [Candidatus Heimdallarchaeota archaeon LC_2]